WPTSTPATSVMALSGPVVPSKGMPKSRPRSGFWARELPGARTRPQAIRRARFISDGARGCGRIRGDCGSGKTWKRRRATTRHVMAPDVGRSMLRPYPIARRFTVNSWPYDRHHLYLPILLLAGEPRPALQPVVRAPVAAVLPGARAAARARRALRPQRRGRDPAGPVHHGGGRVGPAAL